MAELSGNARRICAASELENGGKGVRFWVLVDGGRLPAFVIRHAGQARAYLNRCAHIGVELDWNPGEFFDEDRRYLVCATHGACYDPATGRCVSGRCAGRGLTALAVEESGAEVRLATEIGVELAFDSENGSEAAHE
jgi:nitrite reductase/ring-hydroxylating ferredoxin subunit